MGIQGLLPFFKDIHNHTNLSQFAGKTLGVDGYVWLHRGAYACATEVVLGRPTTKYACAAPIRGIFDWELQVCRLCDATNSPPTPPQHHAVSCL